MEDPGEGMSLPSPIAGEGGILLSPTLPHFLIEEQIIEKKLTFEEASRCLNTLGKDESGVRYAYLMITATDRKLTDVSTILNFKHVLFLDLSDNYLTLEGLQVLSGMPFLLYLKAERNRLESAALEPMYYLQCLLLNKNRITETCDVNQPFLETLELQDNLIYTIQFDVERLNNLRMLNLRGNQLIDFSGSYPPSLEKLYLNQNKICKILMDFSKLANLQVLHLRDNQIRKLNGFTDQLVNLTYLNLRNNKINKMREFAKLQCLPKLDTIFVLENPVSGMKDLGIMGEMEEEDEEEVFGEDQMEQKDPTRIPLLVLLPNLKRINKGIVTFEEKEEAEAQRKKMLDKIFEELSSEEETDLPTTTDFTTDYTTETEPEMFKGMDSDDEAARRGTPATDGEGNPATDGEGNPATDGEGNPATPLPSFVTGGDRTDTDADVPAAGALAGIQEGNEDVT